MANKITDYPVTASAFEDGDFLDISKRISVGPDTWESQKIPFTAFTGLNLFGLDAQVMPNPRNHDLGNNQFRFFNGRVAYTGSDDIDTDLFTLENQSGNDVFRVQNSGKIFNDIALDWDLQSNGIIYRNGTVGVIGEAGVTALNVGQVNVLTVGNELGQTIFSVKNAGNVGVGTLSPNASAVLDISSTDKGLLAPRMTTLQKNAITTPAESLFLYDTDLNRFEFYNGSSWGALDSNFANKDLTVGAGREHILTDTVRIKGGAFQVEGSDTLGANSAFEAYDGDTTPRRIFDIRNDGGVKVGDVLTGVATNGYIETQGNVSTNFFTTYQSTATGTTQKAFVMGFDGLGVMHIAGNSNLILTTDRTFGTSGSYIHLKTSGKRIDFGSNGRTFCVFDEDSDGFYEPATGGTFTFGSPTTTSNAILAVEATDRGFLLPRLTTTQRDAISTVSADNGLMIFNTTTGKINVYSGTAWEAVTSA